MNSSLISTHNPLRCSHPPNLAGSPLPKGAEENVAGWASPTATQNRVREKPKGAWGHGGNATQRKLTGGSRTTRDGPHNQNMTQGSHAPSCSVHEKWIVVCLFWRVSKLSP